MASGLCDKGNGPNGHMPGGHASGSGAGGDGDGHHANGAEPDENTSLLGRSRTGTSMRNERRSRHWLHVVFNPKYNPGQDSNEFFVKALANTWKVCKKALCSSPVNVLLIFVPIGVVAAHSGWSPASVFTLNFLAIMPLAAILSFATEQMAVSTGPTLGGLINATFGNAVELIVSVIALQQGQIEVVQASMLGSILSNLLLVMGMCFLLGGLTNMRDDDGHGTEQEFASATAQTTCSLMTLAAASMIIPATLYGVLDGSDKEEKDASILFLSRGTSIVLLLLYVMYLVFQIGTHNNLFDGKPGTSSHSNSNSNATASNTTANGTDNAAANSTPSTPANPEATTNGNSNSADGGESGEAQTGMAATPETEGQSEDHITWWAAGIVLILVTVIISFCADYLVESIEPIVETGVLSRAFIGLILIPIVGNAAEHVTACVVAVRNKMDLAMGVAIGSSIQIALLVTPALVITGWLVLDQPMSLRFETFQTVAFALSVLVVTYTVQDGKSNYLEGAMLLGLYFIIALAFWASPAHALDSLMSIF